MLGVSEAVLANTGTGQHSHSFNADSNACRSLGAFASIFLLHKMNLTSFKEAFPGSVCPEVISPHLESLLNTGKSRLT